MPPVVRVDRWTAGALKAPCPSSKSSSNVASRTSQPANSGRDPLLQVTRRRRASSSIDPPEGLDGREGSLKKVVAAFAMLASVCAVAVAQGAVVQDFSF